MTTLGITRHKSSVLLYNASSSSSSRKITSFVVPLGGQRLLQEPPAWTVAMGHAKHKKRTLVTGAAAAAAAMVFRIPHRIDATVVVGDSFGGSCNQRNNRLYSYHANHFLHRGGAIGAPNNTPLSEVLRTLVRRLNEPVPLRAAATTTAATTLPFIGGDATTETSTVVEEQERLAELADELVAGYSSLPPLRNFGALQSKDDDDEKDLSKDSCERSNILQFLATECCPNEADVENAMEDYRKQKVSSGYCHHLRKATTPTYEGLTDFVLQQNAVTAIGFLVTLREDLLSSIRYQQQQQQQQNHDESEPQPDGSGETLSQRKEKAKQHQQRFKDLDAHLKSIFSRWFTPGLLSHERITYDSTPAKIIEIIATKEAVHPMKNLDDLKDRLGSSKRVFALFHPCLPNQPLVFVHVALLPSGLPSSMEEIMASPAQKKKNMNGNNIRLHDSSENPKVAAFYSISNGVKGLAGVGLGEYLLKESIGALKEELPCLETFVTLSPIPRFRKWIKVAFLKEEQRCQQRLQKGNINENEEATSSSLLSRNDREVLHRCGLVSSASPFPWKEFLDTLEEIDVSKLIEDVQTTTDKDIYDFLLNDGDYGAKQHHDSSSSAATATPTKLQNRKQFFVLRSVLLKLASRYLGLEKHRGKPLDKVCGFHVGNGAELHDLHFGADLSRGGLSNSYGLMTNYLYDMDTVATNQANFESSGFVVPLGPNVRKWLEQQQ